MVTKHALLLTLGKQVIDIEVCGIIYHIHAQASSQSLIINQTASIVAKGDSETEHLNSFLIVEDSLAP